LRLPLAFVVFLATVALIPPRYRRAGIPTRTGARQGRCSALPPCSGRTRPRTDGGPSKRPTGPNQAPAVAALKALQRGFLPTEPTAGERLRPPPTIAESAPYLPGRTGVLKGAGLGAIYGLSQFADNLLPGPYDVLGWLFIAASTTLYLCAVGS
jgi:hypothetical protein